MSMQMSFQSVSPVLQARTRAKSTNDAAGINARPKAQALGPKLTLVDQSHAAKNLDLDDVTNVSNLQEERTTRFK